MAGPTRAPGTARLRRIQCPLMAGDTYVADLSEGTLVDATFAVQRKQRRHTRNGDPFLSMELADRTGRVPGRRLERREPARGAVRPGRHGARARPGRGYGGRLQIAVRDLEKIEAGDPLELVPALAPRRRDARGLPRVPGRRDPPPRPARAASTAFLDDPRFARAAAHRARRRDAPRLRRRPARAHRGRRDALPRGGAAPPAPELRHPASRPRSCTTSAAPRRSGPA